MKSLSILVSIPDCPEEELWKFLDREDMKTLPESLTKIPDDCFSASPKMEKEQ